MTFECVLKSQSFSQERVWKDRYLGDRPGNVQFVNRCTMTFELSDGAGKLELYVSEDLAKSFYLGELCLLDFSLGNRPETPMEEKEPGAIVL